MRPFTFAIMGAGNIARRFCHAAGLLEGCTVAAVASKSGERAADFATECHVAASYGNYEEMLQKEKPDCVYIATTTDAHYRLAMLCLDYRTPVLCEKAMFMNQKQAETVFNRARQQGVFVMEAMWSRFLPAITQAKEWLLQGRIGRVVFGENSIGFLAKKDPENRFYNPRLGGGAAYDITVYAYEIMTFLLGCQVEDTQVCSVMADTGVDLSDHVTLRYKDKIASLNTSIGTALQARLIIYGESGRIEVPHSHVAKEAFLYDASGNLAEHFTDTKTEDGFTYEIQEAMDCIRAGKIESDVITHQDTIACADLLSRLSGYSADEIL